MDFLFVKGSDKEFFEGKNNLCHTGVIFFKFFKECLFDFMILHQSDCDI